jgi:hypothetical protein
METTMNPAEQPNNTKPSITPSDAFQYTAILNLRVLTACAARHCEEYTHLRGELDALVPGNPDHERAINYTQYLADEAETAWQVCIDRICATPAKFMSALIEKATAIVDARVMHERGAYTEDAERRIAMSIALDLLAIRDSWS